MKSNARFLIALALLGATSWFLHARNRNESVPAHPPLSALPITLETWSGQDLPIDQASRDVLGPGDFLLRHYDKADSDEPFAELFIAYFPTQRTGETMHSPKNCLPGAGWFAVDNRRVTLRIPGIAPFPANQYVVAKGLERRLVLYWYLSHGRSVASEYRAKIQLVADAMRLNRSDGALIRISTPMFEGETADEAMQRMDPFVGLVVQKLNTYIPQ